MLRLPRVSSIWKGLRQSSRLIDTRNRHFRAQLHWGLGPARQFSGQSVLSSSSYHRFNATEQSSTVTVAFNQSTSFGADQIGRLHLGAACRRVRLSATSVTGISLRGACR